MIWAIVAAAGAALLYVTYVATIRVLAFRRKQRRKVRRQRNIAWDRAWSWVHRRSKTLHITDQRPPD